MTKVYTQCAVAATIVLSAAACQGDFLSGGELSNNPNIAQSASLENLFVGTQSALWAQLGSDMSRVTMIWAQHLTGSNQQYVNIDQYGVSEQTTNGFQQALYVQGGLTDMRKLQQQAKASLDTVFWGVSQVQEAFMMGQGADLFGSLVYTHALTGEATPPLDPQLDVYAHVQAVLDSAIAHLAAVGPTNTNPGGADLVYGGDPVKWTRLAYTLKARYYLHTISAPGIDRAAVAALAAAAAANGLQSGDDYTAAFSGNALEQNLWFQFNFIAGRSGYYGPSPTLVDTLGNRMRDVTLNQGESRLTQYFNSDTSNLADDRLDGASPITFASYVENQLLWAEAAYRSGDVSAATTHLNAARAAVGLQPYGGPATGLPVLREILMQKWIADFQLGTEAWTDYRRTCTPNLVPTIPGGKIPGRLFYDANERQTNTANIPQPGTGINGFYNQAQPPLTTSEGTGEPCLAQAGTGT